MFSILNSYDYKNQFTTRKVEIPFLGEYESLDKYKFIYIYAFSSSIDDILTVQFSNKQNDIQYEFNTDRYEIQQNEPLEIIIPKRLNFFRVNITNNSLFNKNIRRVYSVYLFDSQYIKTSIIKNPSGSWLVGIDTNVISTVLPDGAATSALQTSTQNIITDIHTDTSIIAAATNSCGTDATETDEGVIPLVRRTDNLTELAVADGELTQLRVDDIGALHTSDSIYRGGTIKALGVDTYISGTTTTWPSAAVRNDTLATLVDTDNMYAPLQVNADGALYCDISSSGSIAVSGNITVSGVDAESAAITSNPIQIGGRYDETSRNVQAGDAVALAMTSSGHALVSVTSNVLPTGAATSALQTSTENILSSRIPTLGPAETSESLPVTIATDQPAILVNGSAVTQPISGNITILNGTNNERINGILYNAVVITSNTTSATIDLKASGSEMYNSITVSGRSPGLYNMVLEYSNDNSTFYTDHIEPNVKQKGNNTDYEFSFTRTNINHRYVRVYHLTGSSSLNLIYSITRN